MFRTIQLVGCLSLSRCARRLHDQPSAFPVIFIARPLRPRLFSHNERIWKKEKGTTLDPSAQRPLFSLAGGIPLLPCAAQGT
jgi:hypothetical protein